MTLVVRVLAAMLLKNVTWILWMAMSVAFDLSSMTAPSRKGALDLAGAVGYIAVIDGKRVLALLDRISSGANF
jgi:hypothetical protein